MLNFENTPLFEHTHQDGGALVVGDELELLTDFVLSLFFSVFEKFGEGIVGGAFHRYKPLGLETERGEGA